MFMAFQSEGGGMGCKRLDLTRYWTRLKAAGYDPCVTYAGMIYTAAGKEPPSAIASPPSDDDNDNDNDSQVTCSSDLEADEKEISMTEVDETIRVEKEILLQSGQSEPSTEVHEPSTEGEKSPPPPTETSDKTSKSEKDTDTTDAASDEQITDSRRSSDTSYVALTAQRSIDIAQLSTHVGQFLSEMGYFSQAESMLLQAHKNLEEKYPLDNEEQWLLYIIEENLANLYRFQLKKPEAFRWYTKARDTIDKLIDEVDAEEFYKYIEAKGRILDHMGNMKTYDRSYGAAEKMLRQAEECMLECGSNLGKATVQHHMGILRMRQRNFLEAETYFRGALVSRESWYGKSHPHVAEVLNDLAGLLSFPDNTDSFDKYEAEMLYTRAMHIREQSLGPDHILLATTLFHLGRLKMRENSVPAKKEALELLKRALNIRIQKLGPDHHLSDAVRKTIKKLEAEMKSKPVRGLGHQNPGLKGPFSKLSWHDRDLANMKRSQSLRQRPTTGLPKGFNPGRRSSLQRQDAYRTQHSREDPPQVPITVEPPTPQIDQKTMDFPPKSRDRLPSPPSIDESVLQFVELPNYEPNHVTPRGSYSSSPMDSPSQGRRSSLAKDIMKVALNKLTIELEDQIESDSDENQNVKEQHDRNEEDIKNDSATVEYIDTYSEDAKSLGSSRSAQDKTVLESRPHTIVKLKGQRSAVRFSQPELSKSSEDLGTTGITVWHTNSTPSTPVHHKGFTPKTRVQSAGALSETGGRPPKSPSTSSRPHSSSGNMRKKYNVTYEVHRSKCYIPGPHTIDRHNMYSITPGPHSTIHSLLGDPPCPRPTFQYHHGSAWYQVPGRSRLERNVPVRLRQGQVKHRSHSASSVSVYEIDPRRSWPLVNGWNGDPNHKQMGMTQSASWSEGQFQNQ